MKKVLLLLALCWAALAQAATYKYMTFETTQGEKISFSVEGLIIDFLSENVLRISNNSISDGDGQAIRLEILDILTCMYFSNEPTAVDNVLNADAPVDVYSVTGTPMGTFDSMMDAAGHLTVGTYVITNGMQTQTIVVK